MQNFQGLIFSPWQEYSNFVLLIQFAVRNCLLKRHPNLEKERKSIQLIYYQRVLKVTDN